MNKYSYYSEMVEIKTEKGSIYYPKILMGSAERFREARRRVQNEHKTSDQDSQKATRKAGGT